PPAPQFQILAHSRLAQLEELCKANGAKLIILVPPTPSSEDAVRQMTSTSQEAGVDTLVPMDPASLSVRYYQPDELHLNSEGAALFTVALAEFLPQTIFHEPLPSHN